MSTPGFSDPVAALNALVACVNMPSNVVVHTGSLGSGDTIPCCAVGCGENCASGVLQIETGQTTSVPKEPTTNLPPMIIVGKCASPLRQEIILTYRQCFPSNTGKLATPTADLTAAGISVVMSWWDVLLRIWGCSTRQQQLFRFVNRNDTIPEGQCAGWRMYLECDLINCNPTPVVSGGQTVGIGMAGESNTPI